MGVTYVDIKLKNPFNRKKALQSQFLVDTGAGYTVVPEKLVKQLGLKPEFEREFSLADGTKVKRKVGSAIVEFQGEQIASPVVLGEKGDDALLGALTLEAFGLVINPFTRTLHPAKLML
jgi:clan AA aspartic protease